MPNEGTQQRHRPSALKQQNKAHNHGRHKSKGSLETMKKGRLQSSSSCPQSSLVLLQLLYIESSKLLLKVIFLINLYVSAKTIPRSCLAHHPIIYLV